MIQVYSCNLLYTSIVMTDSLFKRVSVFVKKMSLSFCLLTFLLVYFLFTFAFFETGWSSEPCIVSFACKNDSCIYSFLGSMYSCCTSCLYFFISKIFTHVPGIFTMTLQVISIPPWTRGDRRQCLLVKKIHEKFRKAWYFSRKMGNSIFISNFAYFDCKAIKWVMSFKKAFKDLIFLRNLKPSIVMVISYYSRKFKDFIACHLKNKCHFKTETVSSSLFEISETSIQCLQMVFES